MSENVTATATTSAHGGDIFTYCQKHNNREIITDNIDPERSRKNINVCDCSLEYVYQNAFEKKWQEYQSAQREDRRKSGTYLENSLEKYKAEKQKVEEKKAGNAKAASPCNEFILQFGDKDTFGYGSGNEYIAEDVLTAQIEKMKHDDRFLFLTPEYIKNHPQWGDDLFAAGKDKLIVFGCYTHKDEASVHCHIDFCHYHISNRGCAVSNAATKTQEILGLRKSREENFLLDKNGNKIQATDKDGNLRFDEKGKPVFKTKKMGKTKNEQGEIEDNTQGLYALYQECRDSMADIARERFEIERKAGKEHEHLDTLTFQTMQETAATARLEADATLEAAREENVRTLKECATLEKRAIAAHETVLKEAQDKAAALLRAADKTLEKAYNEANEELRERSGNGLDYYINKQKTENKKDLRIKELEAENAQLKDKISRITEAINKSLLSIAQEARTIFTRTFKIFFELSKQQDIER